MKKKLNNKNLNKVMNKFVKKSSELFKQTRQVICCDICGKLLDKNDAIVIYNIELAKNEYYCKECDGIHNPCIDGSPIPLEE